MRTKPYSNWESFFWGIFASIIGSAISFIVPIPAISLITMVMLYFFYLRKHGVKLAWYILGYFIVFILLLVIFGAIFSAMLLGGL